MKKIILPLFAIAALSVTSCGDEEKTEETKENVESKEGTETTHEETSSASGTYNIEEGTTVQWQAKHYKDDNYVHTGTIPMSQGNVTVENGKIVGGKFEFDMSQILEPGTDTTKPWTLQGHIKMPDFFDVANFATADFTINSVEGNNISGTLNVKGASQEITFPAEINVTETELTAKGSTEVDFLKHNIEVLNKNEAAPEEEKMEGPNPTAFISFDIKASKGE